MRPACLRNARSLASQPSPLLPLLAPRAFAAARNRTGQDDCRSQEDQEEKRRNKTRKIADARAGDGTSLGARYVDIFSFASRQLRSYSTSVEAAGADGSQRRDPKQSQKEQFGNGDASGYSEAQRKRMLRLCHRKLDHFKRRTVPRFPHLQLSYHGKYRSLQRRILVLKSCKAQDIEFSTPYNPAEDANGDFGKMAFAALDRRVNSELAQHSHSIILHHHENCATWTTNLFMEESAEAGDIWVRWATFDSDTREQYWPHILVYLLDKTPQRALPFLQALTDQPCVNSLDVRLITDAFEHLARLYLNKSACPPEQVQDLENSEPDFLPTLYRFIEGHLTPHKRICTQHLLFTLTKLASIEELRRVFHLLKDANMYLGYDVLLHFANAFARAGDVDQSLLCLTTIAEGAPNHTARKQLVNDQKFKWTCALTLHRSMLNRDGYHETTRIVGAFVDLGVKLDILLYNIVMHNAMQASDYSTAFKVFNTLEENGLKPDKYTFSTLLRGCTRTSDPSKFEEFAQYSAETAKEMRDPTLAADYLYYRYVRICQESSSPEESIGRSNEMAGIYLEYFSSQPLQPFWGEDVRSLQSTHDSVSDEPLSMDPPPMALYLMLQLEILKASKIETSQVWPLYERFTELVRDNHNPLLSKLARDPIIWNAFLLCFCRAKNFPQASQLVHDMPEHGVQPNVYTWNIFMQAFFKDRQIHAAERVYEIMRTKGIKPDEFTHEVLLRGYARSQQVDKIGNIIEHVSEERLEKPAVLRQLARVHDQERMVYQLEQAKIRTLEGEAAKAKAKEEAERARWAPPKFGSILGSLPKTKEGKTSGWSMLKK